jgi:peptidoglycan hydrolase-like protein with peptidoglycan-binding domain
LQGQFVRLRTVLVALLLMSPSAALPAGPFTALHPEEAYPDPADKPSQDAYSGLISQVQEKLRQLGFDAGPPNGDFGAKTQAALGQFQLSRTIPASGQLDDQTLAELGVTRTAPQAAAEAASAGASADQPPGSGNTEQREPSAGEKPER